MTQRTRRLLLLALVAGLATIAAALLLWSCTPRTAITAANAAKIQPGMTLDEAEAILGGPPRFDATGRVSYCLTGIPGVRPISPALREWTSDEILVMVWIGEDGRVRRCVAVAVRREGPPIVDIVRRWLGL